MDNLRYDDPFLVCADYASYVNCQDEVSAAWQDRDSWTKMSILNNRTQRQVLVGSCHRRVLRRHLERLAADSDHVSYLSAGKAERSLRSESYPALTNLTRDKDGDVADRNARSGGNAFPRR